MAGPTPNNELPDKEYLYGRYRGWEKWRGRLAEKLAHKALDISPDDEMQVNQYRSGFGWKELAVLAAAGVGGLALWQNAGPSNPQPAQQPAAVTPVGPFDSEYEVRFYDKDGNPITVPHISQKPKQ